MKDYAGFTGCGNWYRGNLHCHTTDSDGKLSPGEAAALYRESGYHFLCLSEHNLYTDHREELNQEDFILLPGTEYAAVLLAGREDHRWVKTHHIHGILGTTQMQKRAERLLTHMEELPPPLYFGEWDGLAAAQEMVGTLKRHGMFLTYNHPLWSRVEEGEYLDLEGIWAMEVYNHGTHLESGDGLDVVSWDRMLKRGKQVHAFASDDNHNNPGLPDSCGGWVMVQAPRLTHDDIVESLLLGNYYSSSGPEILDWGIQDGVAWVECSPVNRVTFVAGNLIGDSRTFHAPDGGDSLTRMEYPLREGMAYLRVECTDRAGRTAWTNAVFPK